MKRTCLLLAMFLCIQSIRAQITTAPDIPKLVAQRLADSLSLNSAQENQIYAINKHIYRKKQALIQQYYGTDSLVIKLQTVESERNAFFKKVFNIQQFSIFVEKRNTLIKDDE